MSTVSKSFISPCVHCQPHHILKLVSWKSEMTSETVVLDRAGGQSAAWFLLQAVHRGALSGSARQQCAGDAALRAGQHTVAAESHGH